MLSLRVNGASVDVEADPEMPLLWVLRDCVGLKGTKYGCGTGLCGACLVLIDGEPNHACMVPLRRVGERAVETIEGLAQTSEHPLIDAWVAEQVPQCGYCQPAQIVAAAALFRKDSKPTKEAAAEAMDGVLCRCGTYQRIRSAIAGVAAGNTREQPRSRPPLDEIVVAEPRGTVINDWVSIEPDNGTVLMINHSEMGQGALNAVTTLIAEELEIDTARVRVANAPADSRYANPSFGTQLTGGSTTVRGEWERLRLAGAGAREKLIAAAMEIWQAARAECGAENGTVVHGPTGRRLAYSELARRAAQLATPEHLTLKPSSEFRLIGRSVPRADIAPMSRGTAIYGIDVVVPDMVVALVSRAPTIGGKLAGFDARQALAVPGVVEVLEIESGVAVVARDFWSASEGRALLDTRWTQGRWQDLCTAGLYAELEAKLEERGRVTNERGAAVRALRRAERVIEARYRTPYLAHCTIEPPNCVAHVRADRCDLWVGTQDQTATQDVAARMTGLPLDKIYVNTTFLGGGFGRRLETDFVAEAVELSAKLRRPVQVLWTRDDDLQHDRFRPAHCVALQACLDSKGLPAAWWQRVAGPPVALGNCDVSYAIPNLHVEQVTTRSPLPVGAWRGVGAVQNAFAIESFVDELAHDARSDPLDYRLALLEHSPRHRAVLEAAAEMTDWRSAPKRGCGRGIAVYRAFGSWTAQVAEVSCAEPGGIRVHRIACAIDCGQALNPDTIRAQIEGGIALGLSAALKEEIQVADGRVTQTSFADYPILRYSEMPEIEVRIVEGGEPPGGVGEPGVPPVAPAVANAIFAATGARLRSLPLRL
ncbi:MAG TPA: molybdopterin cofactor-binding domain-containing protein [Gammaproteobacteria bacterium]|jgi:isoquinoline 1-oxidoreductase beta subunit